MANTFTIQELVADAFRVGRVVAAYPALVPEATSRPEAFPQLPALVQDDVQGYSQIGLPFFDKLHFLPHDYTVINERGIKVQFTTPELVLPCALFDLTRVKVGSNRQPLQRNGTVKEFAAFGDWQVQIRTALLNLAQPHRYPEAEVAALLKICDCPTAIPVIGPTLRRFNIKSLYIEVENWQNLEKYSNVQFVTLNCLSDIPLELEPEP